MKILYTTGQINKDDFDRDFIFANPDYFGEPKSNVSEVGIIGDYPNIVEAYEGLGIKVEVVNDPTKTEKSEDPKKEEKPKTEKSKASKN